MFSHLDCSKSRSKNYPVNYSNPLLDIGRPHQIHGFLPYENRSDLTMTLLRLYKCEKGLVYETLIRRQGLKPLMRICGYVTTNMDASLCKKC